MNYCKAYKSERMVEIAYRRLKPVEEWIRLTNLRGSHRWKNGYNCKPVQCSTLSPATSFRPLFVHTS